MRLLLTLILATACFAPAFAKPVSLNYEHADLAYVLQKLAPYLGKNVYLAPEVKGEVTVSLNKVQPMQALNVILKLQDSPLAYKIVGNTVVVAAPERLATIPDDLFLHK